MKPFIADVLHYFRRWFPKRNIIIISERKVKHVPISGPLQFCGLVMLIGGFCWASYSTGSFMAARSALKEQGQALRSVTNARIEDNFSSVYHAVADATENNSADIVPFRHAGSAAITSPVTALSGLDNAKLVARITLLENKVLELKNTNEVIVQRVQDKAIGRIGDLEALIKQTGLNLNDLKKQVAVKKPAPPAEEEIASASEGGPYIPAGMTSLSPQAKEMFTHLDELATLKQILNMLPIDKPIRDAEQQSPFGHRIDPFNGHLAFHSGLDLSGPEGSKIYSPADGKVVAAGRNGAYGNAIDINHGFDVVTRYGHLSQIFVHDGQTVKKGQVIGIQGSTGRSTGQHLHYEVRYRDRPINPKNFLEVGRYVSKE